MWGEESYKKRMIVVLFYYDLLISITSLASEQEIELETPAWKYTHLILPLVH